MDRATIMLMYYIVIGLIFYIFMSYFMNVSRTRVRWIKVFIACIVLISVILFGHGNSAKIYNKLFT